MSGNLFHKILIAVYSFDSQRLKNVRPVYEIACQKAREEFDRYRIAAMFSVKKVNIWKIHRTGHL